MNDTLSLLIGLAMGLNLLALGTSRLPVLIRTVAAQGVLLGLLPLVLEAHALDWRLVFITLATVAGKGLLIPYMLIRAMRAANIARELEPFIGYIPSLLLGAAGTIGAGEDQAIGCVRAIIDEGGLDPGVSRFFIDGISQTKQARIFSIWSYFRGRILLRFGCGLRRSSSQ